MIEENKNLEGSEAIEQETEVNETVESCEKEECDNKKKKVKKLESELIKKEKELEDVKAQLADINDKYMRMLAEYDNFRRRSQKEKESLYADAYCDAIKDILPVLDNLERAAMYTDSENCSKGVQMTLKSMTDILEKQGITEIETKEFNPEYHNAVMHVEDEKYGECEIVDVLQKGYIKGDRVLRYAMVTVAN